jgi:hypothetical protein
MSKTEFIDDLYFAFIWAWFTLGGGELVFLLVGPVSLLYVTMICAVAFMAFTVYMYRDKKSGKRVIRLMLFATAALVILRLVYNYAVLLDPPKGLVAIDIVAILAFLFAGSAAGMLFFRLTNGGH